jgi:hypothetical protein
MNTTSHVVHGLWRDEKAADHEINHDLHFPGPVNAFTQEWTMGIGAEI